MDWSTVLASAGVSTVVSAFVSLFFVRQTTVAQARAERAEASRLVLAGVVGKMMRDLAQDQGGMRQSLRREPGTAHMEDQNRAGEVLAAIDGLPGWRQQLVTRRVRKLFGAYWTEQAALFPRADDPSLGTSVAAHIVRSIKLERAGENPDTSGHLYHRAYCQEPGHPLLTRLGRQLSRLARAL